MVKPKKPKLTPAEKKLLKAEKKRLALLAAEEGKRQVKRDTLTRELKYGELTKKKIGKKWKDIMMKIKRPQLKTELQGAINTTDILLDLKDYIISILLDELDEAENQYAFNFRAHCANIQNIYRIYLTRLRDLKRDYDNDLVLIHYSLNQETKDIHIKNEEAETYLKTMIFQLAVQEKKLENMERSMYMSKQNEMDSKNLEESNLMRKKNEDKFEKTWRSYTKYLENYTKQIKETEKDFEERLNRDNAIISIIKKQTEEMCRQYNILKNAKEQQVLEREKCSARIEVLTNEKDYLHNIFLSLRRIFIRDVDYDDKILTNLVIESNIIIRGIKKNEALAEKILRLYSVVRKLETQREKIFPFPKIQPRKFKVENEWGNLKCLGTFWQKCAAADKTRNNVHDEYLHLLEENCSLKNTIKACVNYSCNQKVPSLTQVHKKILRGSCSSIIIHNL